MSDLVVTQLYAADYHMNRMFDMLYNFFVRFDVCYDRACSKAAHKSSRVINFVEKYSAHITLGAFVNCLLFLLIYLVAQFI